MIASAPRREPSSAPVSNTANVWPGIGIGPIGITTCAAAAVSKLKPITRPTCRTKSSGARATPNNVSFFATNVFMLLSPTDRLWLPLLRLNAQDRTRRVAEDELRRFSDARVVTGTERGGHGHQISLV